jgi:hypothetical protein
MYCPHLYELRNGICYSLCPENYVPDPSYYEICVSILACPPGTVEDSNGLACTKVTPLGIVAKGESGCTSEYTEWLPNLCYINCPATFLENTTECRKKIYVRRTVAATYDLLTYLFFVILFGVFFIVYFRVMYTK